MDDGFLNRPRKRSTSGTARARGSCACSAATIAATPISRRARSARSAARRKVSIVKASGKATLYSYVISHRPAPGFTAPYAIAVVELAEGPRMMTNIVDCPQTPEALQLDMPLEVTFEKQSDTITLPLFRPGR